MQGSTPAENIRKYIDPNQLTVFDVYSKCADALRTGQIDVVTTDNVVLLGFVASSNGAFKLAGGTFTKEPYGVGIPKGDVAFCTFINDTLAQAVKSGAYAQAWKTTAGKVCRIHKPPSSCRSSANWVGRKRMNAKAPTLTTSDTILATDASPAGVTAGST